MHMRLGGLGLLFLGGLFATTPTSTNYTLKSYDFGSGGGSGSSTNYKLNGVTGTQNGSAGSSTTYQINNGTGPTLNANEPGAPTLTNPSSYYDRLKLVLNVGTDPTDTKYAIAISPNAFASTTNYVKSDHSMGTTLVIGDYQTYVSWGGASGFLILGLQPGTTYTVKVKALQGNFSGSAYGPTAAAATVQPSVTFGVTTSLTVTPPFAITFTSLTPGTAANGNATANLALTTNALNGGSIYLNGLNTGLHSTRASYTIPSATANLSVATSGYGAQVSSATQSSGGPMTSTSPFNGTVNSVGIINTTLQGFAATAGPVTSGSIVLKLIAKADSITPSETDYADTLTIVAAMSF